jgi:putative transposase
MAIKLKHSSVYSTYFCTFTCFNWLPLFHLTDSYDLVYKWFNYLKDEKKTEVIAYVIMPNHLHCILHFRDENFELNKIIGNAKRFLAYEIVKRLEKRVTAGSAPSATPCVETEVIINALMDAVSAREKKKGQIHKVFEESFDGKAIFSQKFLDQKIGYIHNNPISGKWQLAKDFTGYEHSSASFYELGVVKHFKPLHFMDVE